MRTIRILLVIIFPCFVYAQKQKSVEYWPAYQNWTHRAPKESGFDSAKLQQAISFAILNESKSPRNLELAHTMTFGREPYGDGIGPFSERGDPTGIIIHKGYVISQWGDPARVDMTFSVTKSFLSTVVGLAFDKGLIKSVTDTVGKYIPPIELYNHTVHRDPSNLGQSEMLYPFITPHNAKLTWDVMLRQTSDWEGTLWGKPDWADRPDANSSTWLTRKRNEPGTVYEYNDVRVNALALATTSIWRRSLPQVLKEYIMDPIGASTTWRWTGYRNSWIVIDGLPVQAVSGGGHWGGGMFINAFDMGRFGLLCLRNGKWDGKQLISEKWLSLSTTPTTVQTTYGFMNFFVNTGRKYLSNAPESAFVHVGNGTNIIYVDRQNDLVIVARWIENSAINEFVRMVLASKQ